ncbi:Flavin-dependent oxidoreductase, luciferase family (includes alkanesulfonate monooxygenase SsuD and methylene tetrahydromethanopterin reductase) [Pedobacter terrae]|uniref:Flavin-dependent oxidoreductase, luciferase family (Includes alkanesulfonate monooxygenase SsuD and methylene tetrahydromethanopterin reductase) n=1 Tax=Pedobacter terrae TaxID=405671 RepID=A0A1G8CIK4_9SPHI|nr:LLM class flavin-dependent oxidoreductase [Pedobacter terrae]SDH45256.1 Flavin-dependent oxidoreductase, luciferase family (includes alkanesulfonate monooxygenase SsuD and methylene tetrahydromethanopterin reductase) [Pedobacter terrae]
MSKNKITLGLLEFGLSSYTDNPVLVLENVIRYCDIADELGFNRFWLTEHHNLYRNSPWSSPEFLLPILLNRTERIKIGSGGVLISYQSPYRLALNFKLLANIFPNRVELGFANSHPKEHIRKLLVPDRDSNIIKDHFINITEVSKFYNDEVNILVDDSIFLPPFKGVTPDLFLLGSSFQNLEKAVELKLNFCRSIAKDEDMANKQWDLINHYMENFKLAHGITPNISIMVGFLCTKSHQRAVKIHSKIDVESIYLDIIGSPSFIYDEIQKISEMTGVSNFVLKDLSNDFKIKFKATELIAKEFSL